MAAAAGCDWRCGGCGDVVFASRSSCRKCGRPKPAPPVVIGVTPIPQAALGSAATLPGGVLSGVGTHIPMRPGDWRLALASLLP